MDYDGSRNNLLEIKSDSGLAWFLYVTKDDNAMKYPFIITYDEVLLEDINMSTVSFGPIGSSSLGRGSYVDKHGSSFLGRDSCVVEAGSSSLVSGTCVLDVGSSSKCGGSTRTLEVGSASHKAGSGDSCVVEAGSSSLVSGTCVLDVGSSSKCGG
ncbi:hypothetical protein TorRG33x02_182220 [Trema orientale]|uniref:Uncharacterized protein n=1 Tax=Trema orientale TaxID=63057 RepID=A0A2P5EKD1_TREOI|nr:hypothetical protein TorRG33x02_182220 [Trema orientale]